MTLDPVLAEDHLLLGMRIVTIVMGVIGAIYTFLVSRQQKLSGTQQIIRACLCGFLFCTSLALAAATFQLSPYLRITALFVTITGLTCSMGYDYHRRKKRLAALQIEREHPFGYPPLGGD